MKNYYALLELQPDATIDEVKKTFRIQIARYHPDKVHHLGKEFQDMAANKAAELTEAYRVLSHEGRRAEYDAALKAATASAPAARAAGAAPEAPPVAPPQRHAPAPEPDDPPPVEVRGRQFAHERAHRDVFVRSAIVERFRQALAQVAGSGYDEASVRGFDIACAPRTRLFARGKGPRLLGRFIERVDAAAIADTWGLVGKMNLTSGDEVCVMLMATDLAPARELATAIAEQRRRPAKGVKVTVIPVNASIWDAHMPTDAPDLAKNLVNRLRAGA